MGIRSESVLIVAFAVAVLVAGCGTSTTVLAPTPVPARCAATVNVSAPNVGAEGAVGKITIATERECQWSISGLSSWLQVTAANGQGPAEITYTVGENRSTSPRTLQLTVLEQPIVIAQAAAVCSYRVTPTELSVGSSGEAAKISVSTEDFCSWTAKSLASWITLTSVDSGQGNGEIEAQVSRNTNERRSGSIEVAGKTVAVTQREASPAPAPPAPAPQPCTFDVTPSTFDDVAASGSTLAVDVTTRSDCTWTIASQAGWLTVDGSPSRTGDGRVQVNVQQNTGGARSGSVTIAGRAVTIAQRAAFPESCTYSLNPTSLTLSASDRRASISVTTQPECPSSASSDVRWMKVKAQPKTGGGTIQLEIDRNGNESARTGQIVVSGHNFLQTVTVTQAGDEDD